MTVSAPPVDDGLGDDLLPVLTRVARALHVRATDLQPVLDAIVAKAVEVIGDASWAGLILLEKGVLTPRATVGEPPRILDELQRSLGDGPCIDAARDQSIVMIDDTADETRWPTMTTRARELGVGSMLCVPLWVDDHLLGALSIYSAAPSAFGAADLPLVELFSAQAALALADTQRVVNLQLALANRDLIGQAKGILIERQKLTPDAAFAVLTRASQANNVKLTVVAQHLVDTGELLTVG